MAKTIKKYNLKKGDIVKVIAQNNAEGTYTGRKKSTVPTQFEINVGGTKGFYTSEQIKPVEWLKLGDRAIYKNKNTTKYAVMLGAALLLYMLMGSKNRINR